MRAAGRLKGVTFRYPPVSPRRPSEGGGVSPPPRSPHALLDGMANGDTRDRIKDAYKQAMAEVAAPLMPMLMAAKAGAPDGD